MIKQRALVAKLKTNDEFFQIAGPIGTEVWLEANTFAVREFTRKETPSLNFQVLVVKVVGGFLIPAELLDYTSDFEVGP